MSKNRRKAKRGVIKDQKACKGLTLQRVTSNVALCDEIQQHTRSKSGAQKRTKKRDEQLQSLPFSRQRIV